MPEKLEKKYRPFRTFEEIQKAMAIHGDWVRTHWEGINEIRRITKVCLDELDDDFLYSIEEDRTPLWCLNCYKFLDGTPFGVLEEVK